LAKGGRRGKSNGDRIDDKEEHHFACSGLEKGTLGLTALGDPGKKGVEPEVLGGKRDGIFGGSLNRHFSGKKMKKKKKGTARAVECCFFSKVSEGGQGQISDLVPPKWFSEKAKSPRVKETRVVLEESGEGGRGRGLLEMATAVRTGTSCSSTEKN